MNGILQEFEKQEIDFESRLRESYEKQKRIKLKFDQVLQKIQMFKGDEVVLNEGANECLEEIDRLEKEVGSKSIESEIQRVLL